MDKDEEIRIYLIVACLSKQISELGVGLVNCYVLWAFKNGQYQLVKSIRCSQITHVFILTYRPIKIIYINNIIHKNDFLTSSNIRM